MIKKVFFVKSINNIQDRPFSLLPELLLIGRSNVGKSSFINALTNNRKITFVSKTPGKTTTLNYFCLNDSFYLVDSPGYGYMKKSKQLQKTILPMIYHFVHKNHQLKIIIQLIDFKVGITSSDLLMNQKLRQYNKNIYLAANKKDKITKNKILHRYQQIQQQCLNNQLITHIEDLYLCSAKTKEGLNHIINLICDKIELL